MDSNWRLEMTDGGLEMVPSCDDRKDYGCPCGVDHATGFSILDGKSNHTAAGLEKVGTWKRDAINRILNASDIAVERGLIRIYKRQTSDEREFGVSIHANGVGFSKYDDDFGTSLAKWLLNRDHIPEGRRFTRKQMNAARKLVLKYSKQLTDIANSWQG